MTRSKDMGPGGRGPWQAWSRRRYRVDAQRLACDLLGRWLCRRVDGQWLVLAIVECEAYYLNEKASHSSLGQSPSRRAMFMEPGTIYMYHSQGGDSLNLSAQGEGNAVLIKAARVPEAEELGWDESRYRAMLGRMQRNNPLPPPKTETPGEQLRGRERPILRIASGQALLCRVLRLFRQDWNEQHFNPEAFYLARGHKAKSAVVCPRIGIAKHRDPHLMLRFVDTQHVLSATKNPLRQRDMRRKIVEL